MSRLGKITDYEKLVVSDAPPLPDRPAAPPPARLLTGPAHRALQQHSVSRRRKTPAQPAPTPPSNEGPTASIIGDGVSL